VRWPKSCRSNPTSAGGSLCGMRLGFDGWSRIAIGPAAEDPVGPHVASAVPDSSVIDGGVQGVAGLLRTELMWRGFLMSASPVQPPDQGATAAVRGTVVSQLLLDQFLPRYDLAVAHAHVFRVPPAECFRAASEVDLFQAPLVRALLDLRGLPQRLVGTLRGQGRGRAAKPAASRVTFRLKDMVGLGWILLGETPGSEMVLGQVSRPWKAVATSTGSPMTPEKFVSFDGPGFAKIATSLRVDPYGSRSSILTMETRVAVTDDASRLRFRRYWLLVGPFSALIRRTTMRRLAADLRRPAASEAREHAGAS
jgi:hypothetical protein